MKKIESTQRIIITVKDSEKDTLTRNEEYFWNEFRPMVVFENEVFEPTGKKLASFSCTHYQYDNYTIVTDNPILISLMIEAGRISVDKILFENSANFDLSAVDNYHRITS